MERAAIVETVSDRTETDESDATDATRAVLTTLGERLSEDQAEDLAAQLPGDLNDHLTTGESGQRFSQAEFVSRIEQRMDAVDLPGERAATAVMGTLLEAVDEDEQAAVVDQFQHYGFETLLTETDADIDVTERSPYEQ